MAAMRPLRKALRRLRDWTQPRRVERELDEELRFHLDMQTRWHESKGVDPATARALAAREFGGELRFREAVMDTRGLSLLHDLGRDVRFALRSYRRSAGFTVVALLTLTLGIGATTAAFSVIDAILLRPLPYADPDRIVTLTGRDSLGNNVPAISAPTYYDWREASRSLERIAIYATARRAVAGAGDAARVETADISADFFRVLRLEPSIGRAVTDADATSQPAVVVVSHGFWVRALGSATPIADLGIRVDGTTYRVVGVLPPGRELPAGIDVFIPRDFATPWRTASRNNINFRAIARLAPGSTIEQARAELRTIASRIHAAHPEDLYAYGVSIVTLRDGIVGPSAIYLRLLGGAVVVVLLVACANLANANLARGAGRSHELAIRTALGAGRMRLVRQLLVESTVLAFVGGAAGVALAWALVRAVAGTMSIDLPRAAEISVTGPVLAFAVVVSMTVGLIVGLAPVLQLARETLYATIASAGRTTGTRRRAAFRDVLIGVEIALAIVLLVGAGLLVRSFGAVISRDLGFVPDNAIAAEVSLPPARYRGARATRFYDELFVSLRELPGVQAVGATNFLPLGSSATGFIVVEGQGDTGAAAGYRVVSDDYFRAMGVPLLAGRFFNASDDSGTTRVTLVNRAMAVRFWPGQDPIGKRFKAKSMEWRDTPWLTVIGVTGNVRHWGLEQEAPVEHYVLYRQRPEFTLAMAVVLRARGDGSALFPVVRARIRDVDPDVPVDLGTLTARVDRSLAERRFIMSVLTAFGVLALTLAAIGVYGVLSFTVAQRTREIAVRMALGAERRRVLASVVGRALRVAAVASAVGLVIARAVTHLMRALLFEVSPADPRTYVIVTAVLLVVALVAAYVPARRAAGVDPMLALRSE
jgi:putative ABC transport system permease protein